VNDVIAVAELDGVQQLPRQVSHEGVGHVALQLGVFREHVLQVWADNKLENHVYFGVPAPIVTKIQ
jgi:hypothetical protein